MVDFSILNSPNFAQIALGASQAGAALGAQKRRDEALRMYAQTGDVGTLERSGDVELLKVAGQQREAQMKNDERAALARVFAPPAGASAPAIGGGAPAGAVTTPAPSGEAGTNFTPPEAVVPQGAPVPPERADGLAINWDALREFAAINPQQATALANFAVSADKAKIERAALHGKTKGQAAYSLRQLPQKDRAAALAAMKPELVARGFSEADIASARLDDASLDQDIAFGMTLEQMISADRAERAEARTEQRMTAAEARAQAAERRAQVRFGERQLDRDAVASSGRVPTTLDDLNY